MTKNFSSDPSGLFDDLRREFVITARQKLADLDDHVIAVSGLGHDDPEIVSEMRREIHSLKGMGGTFGFPALTAVSHRLEDFIASVGGFSVRLDDIQVFLDCLNDILDADPQPDNDELAKIVRKLPAGNRSEDDEVEIATIEVLLVVPNQVLRPLLQHHLEQNGCRVVGVESPFEAIELSVRTLPDLVISSVVLAGLDGVDLLRMLNAIENTQSMKLAVLTSAATSDPMIANLPESISVISTDQSMLDDTLSVLDELR